MAATYDNTDLNTSPDFSGSEVLTKPKSPTAPATLDPTAPSASIPLAGTAPAPVPAPTAPPPLSTSDPLAYQPVSSTPYVNPSNGETYVGGTQTTDPTTGQVTNPGALGTGYVPGSGNGLIDLGGGNVAPTVSGQSTTTILPPMLPPDYSPMGMHIGDVTAAGRITGWNELGGPIYDSSVTDASKPDPFAHTWDGLQAGDLAAQGFSSDPFHTPGHMIAGQTPTGQEQLNLFASRLSGAPSTPTASLSPGGANGAGTPSSGVGSPLPVPTSGAPGAPATAGAPGTPPPMGAGVGLTPTTPDNALTNFTISPNNTVDRVKLAQDSLKSTIDNILNPQFQADLQDTNRFSFGAGRGVSGLNRTRLGNVQSDFERNKANLSNSLLNNATNGSIEDLYRNIGIAQQQQGFQAGQQGTAFGQNLALQQLTDQQKQQAFGQALQQLLAGSQGDPSQIALVLSQIFGQQAGAAGTAASNYASSQQQQQNQQTQLQQMQDFIRSLYGNSTIDNIINQGIPGISTTPGQGY